MNLGETQRKTLENKLGKDVVSKLSYDQIKKLYQYYNSLPPQEKKKTVLSGELKNIAMQMAGIIFVPKNKEEQKKYGPDFIGPMLPPEKEDGDAYSPRKNLNAGKFLNRKTFKNPLIGQQFTAPSIPGSVKPQIKPVVVKIEPDKLIPKNEEANKEIIEKLDELIEVIKKDNELEKKEQDYDRKQDSREKRQKRESKIEVGKIFSKAGSGIKKAIGGFQNIFDTVIRFLVFTLLGQIVKFVADFLRNPKNKKFIEDAQNFIRGIPDKLKELGNKLKPVVDWFKEQSKKIGKFAEDFRKLLTRFPFLGKYFATKEENEQGIPTVPGVSLKPEQIFPLPSTGPGGIPMFIPFATGGLAMGTDTVPAMLTPGEFVMSRGAVSMFGVDTMMAMNKAGGGTNRPKFGLVSGFSGGGFTRDVTKLLENYEGLRLNAYPDPFTGGEPITIGVGATRYPPGFRFGRSKVMLGDSITKEEAYMIKDYDVKRHTKIAKDKVGAGVFEKLPENVKFALISKAFNYGTIYNGALKAVDEGVKTGNYSGLAAYYRNVLAKHNNGINSWRRNDEADIIESGKSNRSGMTFSTTLSAPPVKPAGSQFGPAFDSDERAQAERFKLIQEMMQGRQNTPPPVDNRFSGFNLDSIFKPVRRFLGVDTPNAPTSTKIIVLPTIKQTAQEQPKTQTGNEIPDFKISSGVKMRELVGEALGIEDLVK